MTGGGARGGASGAARAGARGRAGPRAATPYPPRRRAARVSGTEAGSLDALAGDWRADVLRVS
ncbi:hypothetical protein AB0R11_14490, partial [Streptomyces fradiae]